MLDGYGLAGRPQNWGWLCGDFCYYAAAQAFPDYDHYCLIECDVFLSETAAADFVDLLDRSAQQALAVRLGRQAAISRYSRGLTMIGLSANLGCIFPISRVHRDVIPVMLDVRRRTMKAPDGPPNDEAILAAAVEIGGFSAAALDLLAPQLFGSGSFDTNPPHLLDHVIQIRDDHCAYHPVVTVKEVLDRIKSGKKTYTPHRLRKVLRHAPKDIAIQIENALGAAQTLQEAPK